MRLVSHRPAARCNLHVCFCWLPPGTLQQRFNKTRQNPARRCWRNCVRHNNVGQGRQTLVCIIIVTTVDDFPIGPWRLFQPYSSQRRGPRSADRTTNYVFLLSHFSLLLSLFLLPLSFLRKSDVTFYEGLLIAIRNTTWLQKAMLAAVQSTTFCLPCLVSKNMNIETYKITILPFVLYGYGAGVAQSVWCLATGCTIGVRSPAGAKDFSSVLCVQTGSGAHPACCTMGTGGSFPRE
jgi:hypothetical protein